MNPLGQCRFISVASVECNYSLHTGIPSLARVRQGPDPEASELVWFDSVSAEAGWWGRAGLVLVVAEVGVGRWGRCWAQLVCQWRPAGELEMVCRWELGPTTSVEHWVSLSLDLKIKEMLFVNVLWDLSQCHVCQSNVPECKQALSFQSSIMLLSIQSI